MPSGAIITTLGRTKLASATPLNQLNISTLAVGDGNGGYPALTPSMTALTNEVWRGTPSPPIRDPNSPNVLIFEAVIPPSVGGFTVREQAIFDDAGDMIAIGQTSIVEKPLPNAATGVMLTVRLHIQLDIAEQVDLFFQDDPTISAGNVSNANGGSVQDFIDDYAGFTAELLAEAGIMDDGQPDKLGSSQRVDAILEITKSHSRLADVTNPNSHPASAISRGASNVDADLGALELRVSANASGITSLYVTDQVHTAKIAALESGQGSGVVAYATRAELFANLNFADRSVGYVTNDTTSTYNGAYRKSGASGVGSWIQSSSDLTSQAYQAALLNKSNLAPLLKKDTTSTTVKVGKNLINLNSVDCVAGYYVSAEYGELFANASYTASAWISVVGGQSLVRSIYPPNDNTQYAFYDENRKYISGGGQGTYDKVIVVPAEAKFFRTSMLTSYKNTYQVEVGTVATEYEPYFEVLPNYTIETGVQAGDNLYNVADGNDGEYIDSTTGRPVPNVLYRSSGYIPVTAGDVLFHSYANQISYYSSTKKFISGVTSGNRGLYTVPDGAAYLRTFFIKERASGEYINRFANKGFSKYTSSVKDLTVKAEDAGFFTKRKNLFNVTSTGNAIGYYVGYDTGVLNKNTGYNTTHYIPVSPETSYTVSFQHQTAFYDKEYNYISGIPSGTGSNTWTTPADAVYVRCSVLTPKWALFQLELGTLQTRWEQYGYSLSSTGDQAVFVQSSQVVDATPRIAIAPKFYVPTGSELALYPENVTNDYDAVKRRIEIVPVSGQTNTIKQTGESTKLMASATLTASTVRVNIADSGYVNVASKNSIVEYVNNNNTTPVKIINIGDSYTGRMTWANNILKSAAATGVTWLGLRDANATSTPILCDGQGGWTFDTFFSADNEGKSGGFFSQFMQPVNSGYLFVGATSAWIDANSATPTYNAKFFDTAKVDFDAVTGRKKNPRVGDVMGDAGGFIQWNGSAWVSISSLTFGGLAVNFGKYRSAFNIDQPDIVSILLGTNDFGAAYPANFDSLYANYKAKYDYLINSIKLDSPSAKILVGVPVSSGRQGKYGVMFTERRKLVYFMLAERIIQDFGGREAELIYLVDYHSSIDREYGYENVPELPYAGYSEGLSSEKYKADVTHIGNGGFKQMGNIYMGTIQKIRSL